MVDHFVGVDFRADRHARGVFATSAALGAEFSIGKESSPVLGRAVVKVVRCSLARFAFKCEAIGGAIGHEKIERYQVEAYEVECICLTIAHVAFIGGIVRIAFAHHANAFQRGDVKAFVTLADHVLASITAISRRRRFKPSILGSQTSDNIQSECNNEAVGGTLVQRFKSRWRNPFVLPQRSIAEHLAAIAQQSCRGVTAFSHWNHAIFRGNYTIVVDRFAPVERLASPTQVCHKRVNHSAINAPQRGNLDTIHQPDVRQFATHV